MLKNGEIFSVVGFNMGSFLKIVICCACGIVASCGKNSSSGDYTEAALFIAYCDGGKLFPIGRIDNVSMFGDLIVIPLDDSASKKFENFAEENEGKMCSFFIDYELLTGNARVAPFEGSAAVAFRVDADDRDRVVSVFESSGVEVVMNDRAERGSEPSPPSVFDFFDVDPSDIGAESGE